MKHAELKTTILNIARKTVLIPFLEGKAGEGKTQFIKDLCKSEKLTLTILNASALEASDFSGLPYIENSVTLFARPSFFNNEVIFLDELDRVTNSEVRQSLLSLFVDKKINGHEFKGLIFAAGNGQAEGYDTIELDKAFEDRLARYKFSHSVQEKLDYLKSVHSKDNTLLHFLEAKTEVFSQLSSRRIDQALKLWQDVAALDIILGKEISKGYQSFVNGGLVTLKQVASGQYDFDRVSAISRIAIINDLMNEIENLNSSYTDEELKNINDFCNELSSEEKALYFSKLKDLVLKSNNAAETKSILKTLNGRGLFKGQKIYFTELLGV